MDAQSSSGIGGMTRRLSSSSFGVGDGPLFNHSRADCLRGCRRSRGSTGEIAVLNDEFNWDDDRKLSSDELDAFERLCDDMEL